MLTLFATINRVWISLGITLGSSLGSRAWVWGPPELGGTPVPDDDNQVNWLLDAPWAKVALMVTLAVGVLVLANALMRGKKRRRGLRRRPDFDLRVAKLEALAVTPIAEAKPGPVHLIGTLHEGEGTLGTGEHACVFQNRAGSSRSTAIAAELILLRDETGVVGLEQTDAARVIAPKEDHGPHDTIALYLGDRVEIVGEMIVFKSPQTAGGEALRGMMGSLGQIQIRVIERPRHTPPQFEPGSADVDSSSPDSGPSPDSNSDSPDSTETSP